MKVKKMTKNNFLLDIVKDNKLIKQIAHELKNSKGSPAEIMASIARKFNFELPKNINFEIHTNTDGVYFFVMPAVFSDSIAGMEYFIVAAGNDRAKTSTFGTVSSASTFSSASCGATTFSASSGATISSMSTDGGYTYNQPTKNTDIWNIDPMIQTDIEIPMKS